MSNRRRSTKQKGAQVPENDQERQRTDFGDDEGETNEERYRRNNQPGRGTREKGPPAPDKDQERRHTKSGDEEEAPPDHVKVARKSHRVPSQFKRSDYANWMGIPNVSDAFKAQNAEAPSPYQENFNGFINQPPLLPPPIRIPGQQGQIQIIPIPQPVFVEFPQEHTHLLREMSTNEPLAKKKKRRHVSHASAVETNYDEASAVETNYNKAKEKNKPQQVVQEPEPEVHHTVLISEGTGVSMPLFSLEWNEGEVEGEVVKPVVSKSQSFFAPKKSILITERRRSTKKFEKDLQEGKRRRRTTRHISFAGTDPSKINHQSKCPYCDVGKIKLQFTWIGWTFAILLFPCGICLLFNLKSFQCTNCKNVFRLEK